MTERRPNPNRKDENIRRANRVIQTRSFVLMLVMGIGMFVLLFFQLFDLQIVRHEELQSKAVNQQTRRTVVTASRGTIYDRVWPRYWTVTPPPSAAAWTTPSPSTS